VNNGDSCSEIKRGDKFRQLGGKIENEEKRTGGEKNGDILLFWNGLNRCA